MGKLDNIVLISADLLPTDGSFPIQQLISILPSSYVLCYLINLIQYIGIPKERKGQLCSQKSKYCDSLCFLPYYPKQKISALWKFSFRPNNCLEVQNITCSLLARYHGNNCTICILYQINHLLLNVALSQSFVLPP